MTAQPGVCQLILAAQKEIEVLRESWNAGDLAQAAELVLRLNDAAGLLAEAGPSLADIPAEYRGTLRGALRDIKKDLLVLESLTDAADAFWRGLPGAPSESAGGYSPYGEIAPVAATPAGAGIQA